MPAHRPTVEQWTFFVYIMTNKNRTVLYTGVTNDIEKRVRQHRNKNNPNSFASRYNLNRLVFYQKFPEIRDAIAREKQIKGWKRFRKDDLITQENPKWEDLADTVLGLGPAPAGRFVKGKGFGNSESEG